MSTWQLQQKTSLQDTYYYSSAPMNRSSRSSQAPTTWYKNYKGEFIIKDQQTLDDNDWQENNNNNHDHSQ